MTRDPYNFGFARLTKKHNEAQFKEALLNNISKFLLELGTGFAYVVIEVKMGEFDSGDIGQIGTYVTAVNHIMA